jgi:hypothetical protein
MKRMLFIALLAACVSSTSHYDQPIALRAGETARFKDFAITFTRVVSDSRCPLNVTCIQKGDVVVEVAAIANGQHEAVQLDFDHTPRVAVLGHTLELQSVAAATPYAITIIVRPNAM